MKNLGTVCSVMRRLVIIQKPKLGYGQFRWQSGYGGNQYWDSTLEGPPELYTEVEKSYAEWKWVSRLIPPEHVPDPPPLQNPNQVLPSGWKHPNPPPDSTYYIPRNKNHLLPIYLWIDEKERGQKRLTKIRHVEGDIWACEKDIGDYLKSKYPHKLIITWTNEVLRIIYVHGEYTDDVKEFVLSKGF